MQTVFRRSLALLSLSFAACAPNESLAPVDSASSVARTTIIPGSPVNLTADLTPLMVAPQGKVFKLSSCNSTSPAPPYRVEMLDGVCYGVAANVRLVIYKSRYYLVPADAKFALDKYGYFCGSDWGWGSGNNAKTPLPDGGTDKACLNHDKGWSAPDGQQPSPLSVMASDKTLLATLKTVKPTWEYEADYVTAAIKWMNCRVVGKIQYTNSGACYLPAVLSAITAGTMR